MLLTRTAFVCAALLLGAVSAQQADAGRLLIYFDEFSANLSQEARTTLADAARRAREAKAKPVRIEARAGATGSQLANRYPAMTRAQVVGDELAKDGLDPGMLRQVVIGQTGSDDPVWPTGASTSFSSRERLSLPEEPRWRLSTAAELRV